MTRRIVDLSVPLETGIASDPPDLLPQIAYGSHTDTVQSIADFLGIAVSDVPNAAYAAAERCEITTHNGTHLDAPWHYGPLQDKALVPGGRPSLRIDEVPLDWCFQPGVKLDFRHFPDGYVVQAADVAAELARIGHTLAPLEIVLVNTRAGSRYGQADFLAAGCGMGRDATMYLLERGVRVAGIDGWSWDAPFGYTRAAIQQTGNYELIWEGHRAGHDIGYCHMEKLSNLESLPAHGFMVSCFPVKVSRASAGWTRAVAIFD